MNDQNQIPKVNNFSIPVGSDLDVIITDTKLLYNKIFKNNTSNNSKDQNTTESNWETKKEIEIENEKSGIPHIPMIFWITYPDSTPPPPSLTLLVNPSSFNLQFIRKISTNFTRRGVIPEQWGDEQDIINVEGTIGGYYIYLNNGLSLSRLERTKSISYRNLQSLYMIYKNNGYVYQDKNANKSIGDTTKKLISRYEKTDTNKTEIINVEANKRIEKVGSVFLSYDTTIYEGSFDEFNIEEDATKPYTLKYSFKFTVRNKFITDYRDYKHYGKANK